MSNAVTQVPHEFTPHVLKPDEVRKHVQELLRSPAFQGSKRCQQFLSFVCAKSLGGETASLKERTIAIEVFGRSPQSDLADDTIVRVGAREVRKRLQQYYLTPEGARSNIRIDLPTGSYAPEFHASTVAATLPPVETPPPASDRRIKPAKLIGGIAVIAILATGIFLAVKQLRANPDEQAFNSFWSPVFHSSDPLLVAMPHPIVYHPSARAWQLSEAGQPEQDIRVPRPIQAPANKLDGTDMLPSVNQFVGLGDMVAANEVTAMLAQRAKKARVRLASGVEFPDLRKINALLIGAVSNRWTMQLQQGWRFQFRWTPAVRTVILDTQTPRASSPQQWSVDSKPDETYQEDYVVVCRIRNSITGGLLLAGAGIKGMGTEAAGRLLVDSEQLGGILRKLPAGWDAKNVQILLHVKVIGNTPAQPELVAWHVW